MFINDIEINRDKIFEQDKYGKFVIRFNEVLSLDLT